MDLRAASCPATRGRSAPAVFFGRRGGPLLQYNTPVPQLILEDFNLEAAERRLCTEALDRTGSIVGAAELLGITRHAMKRRLIKLGIDWPQPVGPRAPTPAT